MIIIFIRGFAGSGKDTFGNFLVNNHKYLRYAFADYLKEIVSEAYGVPLAKLHSQTGKLSICPGTTRTCRQVLIDEAAAIRRDFPNTFADMCADQIAHESEIYNKQLFVITDWRFPNELTVIRNRFPAAHIFTVLVRRRQQRGVSPVEDVSEYHLVESVPDFIVDNNGSINDLAERAKYIVERIEETL